MIASNRNSALKNIIHKDIGSMMSFSIFSICVNLMGNLMRCTVFVEGWLARIFYLLLMRSYLINECGKQFVNMHAFLDVRQVSTIFEHMRRTTKIRNYG